MSPNIETIEETAIIIETDEHVNESLNNDKQDVGNKKESPAKDELPVDLKEYLEALNEYLPNDYMVPIDVKPNWLDINKCKKGQKFAQQYYFGLNYAEMLSLYLLFLDRENLGVLIYTQKSHTPMKAFKRYLSTVLRVKSWFETEFWNPNELGYKNLKIVKAMHLNVSKKLNETNPQEFENEFSLINNPKYNDGLWCPLNSHVKEDLANAKCPMSSKSIWSSKNFGGEKRIFINQFNMSMTQFGFVGLMLIYPEKFGANNATEEELEAFAHLWKAIGYYLGIKDNYNFCKGNLKEIQTRCKDVLKFWIIPNLQNVTDDWEHMSRCMTEGISYYIPGVSFETSFKYLCWILDVQTPNLDSRMTLFESWKFQSNKFIMCYVTKVPVILDFLNWIIKLAIKRASEENVEWLAKLEKRTYNFQSVTRL